MNIINKIKLLDMLYSMHSRMLRVLLQGGLPAPARWELECASVSRLLLLRRGAVSGRLTTQRRQCSQALSGCVLKVCVVGSGPAGFYTAHQLIKRHRGVHVDILERLPVPFGLVRFGVAPDHPEVKNCINQFTTLAQSEKCRFIGNICLGKQVTLAQLRPFYHAIVMAYGAEDDRVLGVPGEELSGVYSARAFVGWYNGLPAHKDVDLEAHVWNGDFMFGYVNMDFPHMAPPKTKKLNPDLSGDVAVVLGQGNVALDVARMLLTPVDLLKGTDICQHALDVIARSRIQRVQIVGRRGPLQVAFTIKELREMTKLPGCRPVLDPRDFDPVRDLLKGLPRPRKRLSELMVKTADEQSERSEREREWGLTFLRSPIKFIADGDHNSVSAIRMEINQLEGDWETAKAVGTGKYEEMKCSVVLRSIGYKTLPVDKDVPFDPQKGIIPNFRGKVLEKNEVVRGLYCSGWVKTGPVGVILTTMDNAFETAELIIQDFNEGQLRDPSEQLDVIDMLSCLPGVCPTSFQDWENIDNEEQSVGAERGKPREKVISLERMMEIVQEGR